MGKRVATSPFHESVVSTRASSTHESTPLRARKSITNDCHGIKYRSVIIRDSNWRIDERYTDAVYISEGAYGEVVRAKDTHSDQSVVIKKIEILVEDNVSDWENSIRILREVHFLSNITHPYVCSLVDLFPCQRGNRLTHMFIVTPYYNLGSLDTFNISSIREGCEIFSKILLALQFIHKFGVVHRDLKRDNVFVSRIPGVREPHVVLGDFGLSRVSRRSMTHEVVTRPYRAPELIMHETHYGPEIDAFAAGCVLFEMFAMRDTSTLIADSLLGGATQLQAQLALCPTSLFDHRLLDLARVLKYDLPRYLLKSKSGQPFENAKKHWGNLEGTFIKLRKGHLLDDSKDLIKKLISFNPRGRIRIEDALIHPLLLKAGVSEAKQVFGTFENSQEDYQDEIENLATVEQQALGVKCKLWSLMRKLQHRAAELPQDLTVDYPGEILNSVQQGKSPRRGSYQLRIEDTITDEPVAKRTRSFRK